MVVPVFITNCHVSLNPKTGPKTAQTIMIVTASMNVTGLPAADAVAFENRVNSEDFGLLMPISYRLIRRTPKIHWVQPLLVRY